jgi:hypothetical protein
MIAELEKQNAKSIEATHDAEIEWKKGIETFANMTLLPQTRYVLGLLTAWFKLIRIQLVVEWRKCLWEESGRHDLVSEVFDFRDYLGDFTDQCLSVLGIETYEKQCRETIVGWKGFDVVVA